MMKQTFTPQIMLVLYRQYAKSVFLDAVRSLIKQHMLQKEEQDIISKITAHMKTDSDFITKSYIVYLSNGVLLSTNPSDLKKNKEQLFFELALCALDFEEEIAFESSSQSLFSIFLNQHVSGAFDLIRKERDSYCFYLKNSVVCSVQKNSDCAIAPDIDFLTSDKNPFNSNNDHPDQAFVSYDLGGKSLQEWTLQFKQAYQTIEEKTPQLYSEIYPFLDAVVPHGYAKGKQMSSSYSKSPGILYLSYTDNYITQAEALVHEIHHTIFNIIHWKYPLYLNDMSLQYYSTYRPDARHIHGCFLGLHAFVAVQGFYRMLSKDTEKYLQQFIELYLKNEKQISVLKKHAQFTKEGALLFEDILLKFQADTAFFNSIIESHSRLHREVLNRVEDHFKEVQASHKELCY